MGSKARVKVKVMISLLKISKWLGGLSFMLYIVICIYIIYLYNACQYGETRGWYMIFLIALYIPLTITQFLLFSWSRKINAEHKFKVLTVFILTLLLLGFGIIALFE